MSKLAMIKLGYEYYAMPVTEMVKLLEVFQYAIPIERNYNEPDKIKEKTESFDIQYLSDNYIKELKLKAMISDG